MELSLGALHFLGCSQIGLRLGNRLQCRQRHALLQSSQPFATELVEGRQRCLHIRVAIAFDDLAFGADGLAGEHAGAVQIQPRIEHLTVEHVDGFGVPLRDVAVAHVLTNHAGIFALGQRVVIAVA